MANFFIRRPIFAWVLAIILMMAGALAILQLPVAQYPTIAPPAVSVSANYPGADAQTVQDTVTQVIEQNMNGIDNLMYMSSTSDSAGSVTITLTFQSGTDPDIVLDPFAGSFTTGAVAIASGRKFIGIEINSEYIKMGLRRLDVASHYSAEELAKVKKRKTGNLSKRSRLSEVDPDLITK